MTRLRDVRAPDGWRYWYDDDLRMWVGLEGLEPGGHVGCLFNLALLTESRLRTRRERLGRAPAWWFAGVEEVRADG